MREFILQRFLQMLVVLCIVTVVSFVIIELPPGDYLTNLRGSLQMQGFDPETIEAEVRYARDRYGLGDVWYVRFWKWSTSLLRGDLGQSMSLHKPIAELIGDRLLVTMLISIFALLLMLVISIPVGMFSAVRQYSKFDYIATVIAFIGVCTPTFVLALVSMFISVSVFGSTSVGSLFSAEYVFAPWSWGRFIDLVKHMWIVVVIVGASGTAGTIRVVRARMLDTLSEPFIDTARMKGISSTRVYLRHALRVALNPVISSLGLRFPSIISGSTIVGMVLVLPTIGPLLLTALQNEDIYLAIDIVLLLTVALIIGNFVADVTLAWLDPRIRLGR